ncbi:MAG: hypothetical protein ABI921_13875, partial [Panacibacter sp.]
KDAASARSARFSYQRFFVFIGQAIEFLFNILASHTAPFASVSAVGFTFKYTCTKAFILKKNIITFNENTANAFGRFAGYISLYRLMLTILLNGTDSFEKPGLSIFRAEALLIVQNAMKIIKQLITKNYFMLKYLTGYILRFIGTCHYCLF